MISQTLITATSTAYAICIYLQEFCQKVGVDNYLTSPIRLQHGTGTGGFSFKGKGKPKKRLMASGNNDCAKERFRAITDSLDLSFRTPELIKFKTASCVNLTEATRNKETHRIEHTEELIDLFLEFEQEYIIGNKPFTPNELARFVLSRTMVCLIEQKEQKTGNLKKTTYDPNVPFSKYSNIVLHDGRDVSQLTKDELRKIVATDYADIFKEVDAYDFTEPVTEKCIALIGSGGHHSLAPMDLAVTFSNSEFSLLKYYYHYQLEQITNISNSGELTIYYNSVVANEYRLWNK